MDTGLLTLRVMSHECGAPAPGWSPKVRESKERQSSSLAWSDHCPDIQRYATTAPGLYRALPLCRTISRSQGFMLRLVLHTEADLVVVRHRRLRRGTAQLLGYKSSYFPLLHLGPVSVLFTAMQPAPNCQPLTPNCSPELHKHPCPASRIFGVCISFLQLNRQLDGLSLLSTFVTSEPLVGCSTPNKAKNRGESTIVESAKKTSHPLTLHLSFVNEIIQTQKFHDQSRVIQKGNSRRGVTGT